LCRCWRKGWRLGWRHNFCGLGSGVSDDCMIGSRVDEGLFAGLREMFGGLVCLGESVGKGHEKVTH
jgi:hypothetical protein